MPAAIASVGAMVVAIAAALRTASRDGRADAKADLIVEKTNEIHTLTNSNLSKVTESLNVALKEIDGLKNMVATLTENKHVADRLAEKQKPKSEPAKVRIINEAKDPVPTKPIK